MVMPDLSKSICYLTTSKVRVIGANSPDPTTPLAIGPFPCHLLLVKAHSPCLIYNQISAFRNIYPCLPASIRLYSVAVSTWDFDYISESWFFQLLENLSRIPGSSPGTTFS